MNWKVVTLRSNKPAFAKKMIFSYFSFWNIRVIIARPDAHFSGCKILETDVVTHVGHIFLPYGSFDKLEKRRNKVWWWYLMLLLRLAQKCEIADSPKMREVCMPYKYSFCLKEIKGLVFFFRNLANPAPLSFWLPHTLPDSFSNWTRRKVQDVLFDYNSSNLWLRLHHTSGGGKGGRKQEEKGILALSQIKNVYLPCSSFVVWEKGRSGRRENFRKWLTIFMG